MKRRLLGDYDSAELQRRPQREQNQAGHSKSLQQGTTVQLQHEIAPERTGHGLPLSKCEGYNRVYDQF
jgi:hypothetical protein